MNLFNLFRRQPRKLILIRRFSSRVRLHEYRAEQTLVTAARKFLTDPEFSVIVDVLRNENPSNWIQMNNVPIEQRAIIQAQIEGYTMCISNLESMGVFVTPKVELEATFEAPEEEVASPFAP